MTNDPRPDSSNRLVNSKDQGASRVSACHSCDQLHRRPPSTTAVRADCSRCGTALYRHVPDSLVRCTALYLAAIPLLLIANTFPLLGLKVGGISEQTHLLSGAVTLWRAGMEPLGVLVMLTSFFVPLTLTVCMLYLLVPASQGREPWMIGPVYRFTRQLTPWSLIGVFVLGVMIASVKLRDLATVIPGAAMVAMLLLMMVLAAARAWFDPEALWAVSSYEQPTVGQVRAAVDVCHCHGCGLVVCSDVVTKNAAHTRHGCPRCGSALHKRKPHSVQHTFALIVAASLLLLPANLYPIMTAKKLGKGQPDTIFSGITELISSGFWGLALIVLVASIVVPVMKLLVLGFLLWSVKTGSDWRPQDRTRLFRLTEIVGAWSMVDVFLVALLAGLVNLGLFASVTPHIGITFFAAVVVLTMFAAHSFDPRLIWDQLPQRMNNAPSPVASTKANG